MYDYRDLSVARRDGSILIANGVSMLGVNKK